MHWFIRKTFFFYIGVLRLRLINRRRTIISYTRCFYLVFCQHFIVLRRKIDKTPKYEYCNDLYRKTSFFYNGELRLSIQNRLRFTHTRTRYNKIRKRVKYKYKVEEGRRLKNIAKSQSRTFWKSLKKCHTKDNPIPNELNINDLFNHFNSIYGATPENDTLPNNNIHPNISDEELDSSITLEEIKRSLNGLLPVEEPVISNQ